MMMLAAESDADMAGECFHDAMDHLEEENENEYSVAAADDVDKDESTMSTNTTAEPRCTDPPQQLPIRELTEESWQSTRSTYDSVKRESSAEGKLAPETQSRVGFKHPNVSLFDALSGSKSDEENAELLQFIPDSSAEMKIAQSSLESPVEQSNNIPPMKVQDGDTTANDVVEEEEVEDHEQKKEKPLTKENEVDLQNHAPPETKSETNEEVPVAENRHLEEDEAKKRMDGAACDDDVEETTRHKLETSTMASSSSNTATKEELQPDQEKQNVDELSEQLPEVVKSDEKESDDIQTSKKIDCCVESCAIGSPLEMLFLIWQGGKSDDEGEKDIEFPVRTSVFSDADPKAPASISPIEDQHHDYESESSDDSSTEPIDRFQMINKDPDNIHGVRSVMRDIDFLPDRVTLEYRQRLATASTEMKQSDVSSIEESFCSSPSSSPSNSSTRKRASGLSDKLKRGVAGLKPANRHHRKGILLSEEIPGNAVYVRSSKAKLAQLRLASSSSEDTTTPHIADSSFNPMLLVKTVKAHDGAAWCAAFSRDGRFLSTGGQDGNVTIWAVAPKSQMLHPQGVRTRENVPKDDKEKEQFPPLSFIGLGPELATNTEIISSEPIQRYRDHTSDVIDLSWSHTNFLLSASVDKSVRLYHHSKSGCLHLFKHANLVASVDFHPQDDRYFISGGLDKKLRLWNITEGRVKDWAQAPEVITSARFTPDGKFAVAGLFRGQVYLYEADGRTLKYYTQISCRNRRGKNRQGKKVTGISFLRERGDQKERSPSFAERLSESGSRVMSFVSANVLGNPKVKSARRTDLMMISTNDSSVRLYGLTDFCIIRKYKGHTNNSMQIRARVCESGSYIACGSESGHCFIWDVDPNKCRRKKNMINMQVQSTKDKTKSTDYFVASKGSLPIVTDTLFFPTKAVRESLLNSEELFPHSHISLAMDRIQDDFSNAAILTLDHDGAMRVFIRKSCLDNILDACTPRGGAMT